MIRLPIVSSNLSEVGYESDSKILEVAFRHGGVYRYADVPRSVYEGLMAAPSAGRYFDVHVKKAGYLFVEVD